MTSTGKAWERFLEKKSKILEKISPLGGAELAIGWGFPRPLSPNEMVVGRWFTNPGKLVCWLESGGATNVWFPHYATNPLYRGGKASPQECWEELKEIAVTLSEGYRPVFFVAIDPGGRSELFVRRGFTSYPDLGAFILEYH